MDSFRNWTRTIGGLGVVAIMAAGCSGDSRNNTCQSSADCGNNRVCFDGRCINPADAPDAGFGDVDEGSLIEPEDYLVSYYLHASIPAVRNEVRLYSTVSGDLGKLNPESMNCGSPNDCMVTASLDYLIHVRPSAQGEGTLDAYAHAIAEDYTVSESGTVLAEGVREVRLFGDMLTYTRMRGEVSTAYYKPASGGTERAISEVGSIQSSSGAFHLEPEHNLAIVYRYDLQNLRVHVGPMGQPVGDPVFGYNTANYQQSGGTHFGGHVQTAVSRDGRLLAYLLDAPNDYGPCEVADTYNSPQCTGVAQKCGTLNLCTAREVTLHFIDLENRANLGEDCTSASACGEIHECYRPNGTTFDGAFCQPKRVPVGVPSGLTQGGKTGCEWTRGRDSFEYTTIRGPLEFGPDDQLYTVASRQCVFMQGDPSTHVETNIEKTNIIRVNPRTGTLEEVWGNPGEDFNDGKCYNEATRSIDVTNCIVHIRNAMLSPEGKEIVFVATNPQVLTAGLASQGLDLWRVRRDGVGHDWVGKHSDLAQVRTFQIHRLEVGDAGEE
jgi:hypothetical protein